MFFLLLCPHIAKSRRNGQILVSVPRGEDRDDFTELQCESALKTVQNKSLGTK